MKCPFCDTEGSRMAIHAHLADAHTEKVEMGHHDGPNDPYFRVGCPACDQDAVQSVNPGGRDPRFLEEFEREVRLVAFDLLLYHLQAEHPELLGLTPGAPDSTGIPA
jgi:hypothetical protein